MARIPYAYRRGAMYYWRRQDAIGRLPSIIALPEAAKSE
jgi:hypothetical protein